MQGPEVDALIFAAPGDGPIGKGTCGSSCKWVSDDETAGKTRLHRCHYIGIKLVGYTAIHFTWAGKWPRMIDPVVTHGIINIKNFSADCIATCS